MVNRRAARRVPRWAGRRLTARGASRGYTLVVLTMMVAVIVIGVAAVLPLYSQTIRRHKEQELIFRGIQYAEAIRVFQQRFNRPPVRLEELIEVQPRSIRQLWENPMTEDGRWGLVMVQAAADAGARANPSAQQPREGQPTPRPRPGQSGSGQLIDPGKRPDGAPPVQGPIKGVFSPDGGQALLVWSNENNYGAWLFTTELLATPLQSSPDRPPLPVNASQIGKPWPPGLILPNQPGGQPGGGQGGAGGGQPGRPKPPSQPRSSG